MNTQGFLLSKLITNQGLSSGHFLYIHSEGHVGVVELQSYFKRPVQQWNVDTAPDVGTGGGYSTQGPVSYGGQRRLYGFRAI